MAGVSRTAARTGQNATIRDDLTRTATVLSYLAVRRFEGSSPFASTHAKALVDGLLSRLSACRGAPSGSQAGSQAYGLRLTAAALCSEKSGIWWRATCRTPDLSSSIAELAVSARRLVVKRAEPTVQRCGRTLSSTEGKASIRANKPVPECRTQLHAVADDPRDGSLDQPERDGAGRSDTNCDISWPRWGWSAYLTIPSSTGRARKTADDARPIAPLMNSTHSSVTLFSLSRGLRRWRSELLRNPR